MPTKTTAPATKASATSTPKTVAKTKVDSPDKPKASAKKTKPSANSDAIAAKAYEIFQKRMLEGRPGDHFSDWVEAENSL
jgi:hypothetical protein